MDPALSTQQHGRRHADQDPVICSDRRRSGRRQLRQPTRVSLHDSEPGTAPRASGTLLNLCADGLALQLPATVLDAVHVGGRYRISFDLGEGESPFDLPGCISNIVEGATPDHAVVGVEFFNTEGSAAEARRLCEVIQTHHQGGE